jgi:fimbrial isopeptide formation D2 family protein/LPXTG-motif cell wall-anchored protein
VGQTVYFELIGHISSKISDFAQYYYEFSDDLSSGLTYSNNTVKVYLDSVSDANDVTKYFYVNNELAEDGSTHLTVAISDLKQLNNVKDGDTQKYTVAAGTKIYVTYEAALNQNAVTTSSTDNGGNPNTVKIVYTNNPNNSGTATTEEPTDYSDSDNSSDKPEPPTDTTTGSSVEKFARVYTAAIKIVKTDEDGAVLSGAKFGIKAKGNTTTLSEVVTINTSYIEATDDNSSENSVFYTKDNDGVFTVVSDTTDPQVTKYIVDTTSSTKSLVQTATKSDYDNENYFVGEVSDDGIVAFSGLGQGDYTITETQAPENYNRGDDLEISIEFDSNNKTFSVTGASFTAASDGYLGDVFIGYIQNGKGSQLPTTGGIGTTIFYVVGTILVLGAGVALVVRRRMRKETHQI